MLSFIIPVYKTPLQLLRNCLDSVLRYSQPMELVCVLDSPGDACESVLDEYARKEPRMRLLKNDRNRGVSYARNRGIDAAKGEWLAFVDADDEIIAETYEKAVALAEREKVNACAVTPDNEYRSGANPGCSMIANLKDELLGGTVAEAYCWAVFPMVIRCDAWRRSVGHFVVGHRFCEDYMAVVKLLCADGDYAFLNVRGYKGVGHSASACRSPMCAEKYTHCLVAINSVLKDIVAFGASRTAIRWYLQHTIPLALFDPRVKRYVIGQDRAEYITNIGQLMMLVSESCLDFFTLPAKLIVTLIARMPSLWFSPMMPLLFALRILSHFKLMLR